MDVWKSMVSGKAMQEHMEDVYHNKLKVCSTSSLESYPHPLACLQMLSLLLSRISYVGCTCTCSHQFIHVFVHFQTLQQPWLPSNARLYYSDMKACDYLHYQEDWCTIDRGMSRRMACAAQNGYLCRANGGLLHIDGRMRCVPLSS